MTHIGLTIPFLNAQHNLKEGIARYRSDPTSFVIDGTIRRFEIVYELGWRILREILKEAGFASHNPRKCFSLAEKMKIMDNPGQQMIIDRLRVTYFYTEEEAMGIFANIKKFYAPRFDQLARFIEDGMRAGL